jgi:hypothetical protein
MKGTITVPGTPKAKTNSASGENQTEAVINGSIEPEGNMVEYHFEYGTNNLSENKTATSTLGATDFGAPHSVSAAVSGLTPGKTYQVQLIATYGVGKTVIPTVEQMFTTPAAIAPTVKLSGVTTRTESEATLNGTVDPNGGEETKYFFEYGTTPTFEPATTVQTLPKTLSQDNLNHSASEKLIKLAAGTIYYFKLVAKNKAGEKNVEGTFETLSTPPSEPPPPPPPPPTSTTTTTTSTIPAPLFEPPPGPPLADAPSLRSTQHGASVRGSVDVAQSGAGGELEVDLLAKSASLAAAHRSGPVRVGRFVRASVSAGKVPFAVGLSARAKSALRRHHRLALTVRIVLTPTHGATVTIARSVSLHV